MKELLVEIGMALFGLALCIVVFQISTVGVTTATNSMFTFMTSAFDGVQN